MSTLADLRSALRVLLNDVAAGGYLWSDGRLDRFIADAVKAYSAEMPREQVVTVTTVAGQGDYVLPAELVRVVRVYDVAGETTLVPGGDSWGFGYQVFAGKLRLLPETAVSGLTVEVFYLGSHAALASDGDVSSVPVGDEELLLARAAAMAVVGLGADEAKRRRFEQQAGKAAGDAASDYVLAYTEGLKARKRTVRVGGLVCR